jgi:hypothetical protein
MRDNGPWRRCRNTGRRYGAVSRSWSRVARRTSMTLCRKPCWKLAKQSTGMGHQTFRRPGCTASQNVSSTDTPAASASKQRWRRVLSLITAPRPGRCWTKWQLLNGRQLFAKPSIPWMSPSAPWSWSTIGGIAPLQTSGDNWAPNRRRSGRDCCAAVRRSQSGWQEVAAGGRRWLSTYARPLPPRPPRDQPSSPSGDNYLDAARLQHAHGHAGPGVYTVYHRR